MLTRPLLLIYLQKSNHQLAQLFLITLNLKRVLKKSFLKLTHQLARTPGPTSRANPRRVVRIRMKSVSRCPKDPLCNLRRHLQQLTSQIRAARAELRMLSTSFSNNQKIILQSPRANFLLSRQIKPQINPQIVLSSLGGEITRKSVRYKKTMWIRETLLMWRILLLFLRTKVTSVQLRLSLQILAN